MLKQLIRLAFRNLKNQKYFSVINAGCLAIGLLVFFFDLLYIRHELSFDKFHKKSDRTYRLITSRDGKSGAIVPYQWGNALKDQWAEVERLATIQKITIALTVRKDEEVYAQHGFVGADSTFFDIFDFPVIEGPKERLLKTPNKMVITPQAAKKYFGDQDPIGKTLEVSLWGTYITYEIEGIVQCPANSHLQFQFLIPIHYVRKHFFSPTAFDSWTTRFAYTYVLLNSSKHYRETPDQVRSYLKDFLFANGGERLRDKFDPDLERLEDIYLKSNIAFDFPPRGSFEHVRILIITGFGILLMAIFNFVNLTSAQNLRRIKEIGLKKILGSSKKLLIVQLLLESVMLSVIALCVVIVSILALLPSFNALTGKSFTPFSIVDLNTSLLFLAIAILVGVVSGAYPAVLISGLKPTSILTSRSKGVAGNIRKYLVITQFILTILLLGGTGVIYKQVTFMQNKDLGFNKDQVLVMQDVRVIASDPLKTNLLRNELIKTGQIHAVSASSSTPGQVTWGASYVPEGWSKNEKFSISTVYADHDFGKTYDLEIIAGRDFNRNNLSDSTAYLINEAAVKLFSSKDPSWLENPINKKLSGDFDGPVIGVVNDFHLESLQKQIVPLVIQIDATSFFNIQMKVPSDDIVSNLDLIESTWKKLFPEIPFTYSFVDKEFSRLFESDLKIRSILSASALISVLIAILGLFGLTTFHAFQKAKEISIRKVVGANESQLFKQQILNFMKPVLIANVIAIPLNLYLMSRWLNTYAYRIDVPVSIILLSVLFSLVISALTIFYHVLKTARINPVEVLATE